MYMSKSIKKGFPQEINNINTIADSLGAPKAQEYSFSICRDYLHDIIKVSDDDICYAMRFLFENLKLAIEPAGAAATAAYLFYLKKQLVSNKIGIIICGSNIDLDMFYKYSNY